MLKDLEDDAFCKEEGGFRGSERESAIGGELDRRCCRANSRVLPKPDSWRLHPRNLRLRSLNNAKARQRSVPSRNFPPTDPSDSLPPGNRRKDLRDGGMCFQISSTVTNVSYLITGLAVAPGVDACWRSWKKSPRRSGILLAPRRRTSYIL